MYETKIKEVEAENQRKLASLKNQQELLKDKMKAETETMMKSIHAQQAIKKAKVSIAPITQGSKAAEERKSRYTAKQQYIDQQDRAEQLEEEYKIKGNINKVERLLSKSKERSKSRAAADQMASLESQDAYLGPSFRNLAAQLKRNPTPLNPALQSMDLMGTESSQATYYLDKQAQ